MKVLFVCMGNICRSPAAEGVFKHLVEERGLTDRIEVDSAGTSGYHVGEPADTRMRAAATDRGLTLTSRARRIEPADLDAFDIILVMDRDNLFHVEALDPEARRRDRIRLLSDYVDDPAVREIPDPYYGAADGFDHVLDLLEKGCAKLLDELEQQLV